MKNPRVFSRILLVVMMAALAVSAACVTQLPPDASPRTVHVSLVDKGTITRFLNRLAVEGGHVVATRASVDEARQRAKVREEPGFALHLVEGAPPSTKLRGERARVGGVAVVAVPSGSDPHEFLGSSDYFAERIAEDETSAKAPAQKPDAPGTTKGDDAGRGAGDASFDAGVDDAGRGPTAPEAKPVDVVIERAFLEARLRELSGATPVTLDGSQVTLRERSSASGRALARAWLRTQYEALGFVVQEQTYEGGVNVVADKKGRDASRVLILSAHYDSVTNAGADDDGTGIVSALAIARALKDATLTTGLRVVAFDQEEIGLAGSKAYVASLEQTAKLSQVVGVINLEMTGYDSDNDGRYHVIDCQENTSASLTARVAAAVASRSELRLIRAEACTNRSDHAAFWLRGVPAIVVSEAFFSGDGNPCYHQACDAIDRINWDYMRRVTEAVGLAAARIAE